MKERGKRKGSYIFVRSFALFFAVFCASSSLFICASAIQPDPVVSDMLEPVPTYSYQNGVYTYFFSWITYRPGNTTNDGYLRHDITVTASQPIDRFIATNILVSSGSFSFHVSRYHLDGTLIFDRDYTASYNSYQGYYQASLQYNLTPVSDCGYYYISTSDIPLVSQSEPFVTWATGVPDQIQYRSSLPLPIADIHNRYIVINDRLYWISLYIDNLWVNPITGSVSQSNDNLTAVVTGNASDPTDGDLYYNYNVSITYQDKEYYCAQYNGIDYSFEDMCCPALIYTSSGSRLTISFDQLSAIYSSIQDILVDYRIYCSSFDLVSGEYIESVYSAQGQVGNADISINISCPDSIESIYCYGVEFQNPQNLPVNLGSVLWSYDLDFASWRSEISSKLDAIYALLSQSSVPSTTAPVDYASLLDPEPTVSGYNAEDAGSLLAGAVSDVNAELGDGMDWGRNQINDFATGVPELFLVLILALAFGLTILILGKKKSDN